ncbi:MAG TPA: helix-turn-helix transcriptional regulator [Azonexus sp.]|nr:helix-turn-helix transcriptional regulator [Azonexus sp.]
MATVSSAPEGFTARQTLAANLRRLRSTRGWSQEELAFECELHRTFIAHVERSGRNISLDNLERLAKAFQVPVFELLLPQTDESCVRRDI